MDRISRDSSGQGLRIQVLGWRRKPRKVAAQENFRGARPCVFHAKHTVSLLAEARLSILTANDVGRRSTLQGCIRPATPRRPTRAFTTGRESLTLIPALRPLPAYCLLDKPCSR